MSLQFPPGINVPIVSDAKEKFRRLPMSPVWVRWFIDLVKAVNSGESADLTAHLNDTDDAHDAASISVVPFGTISSTNVQDALEEIVAETSASGGEVSRSYALFISE